jgi:Flp pilus assembly protein TadD
MKGYLSLICLAVALALSGCQSSPTETNAPTASAPSPSAEAAKKEAEHEHSAPHGGALIELGEEFAHVEIVLDAATGKLTAYALDGEAEKAVRIKQSEIEVAVENTAVTIKLAGVANALTGETADDTSEFSGQSERLKGATDFDGIIKTISIKGKEFKDVAFNFPKGNEKQ